VWCGVVWCGVVWCGVISLSCSAIAGYLLDIWGMFQRPAGL